MSDRDLLPIPIEIEAYVALLQNPILASALLGLPFGLAAYGAALAGMLPPTAEFSPEAFAVLAWGTGALTADLLLSKPF